MPELPEVEAAMDVLRRCAQGRTITAVKLLHPALKRRVSPGRLRALRGAQITRVERRGKHQLLHLGDGRIIHVHFRMNGDWSHGPADSELPRFARAVLDFDDGTRLVLVDSRMLGTLDVHLAGEALDLGLGPDAADPGWTAEQLRAALATKRGPIKPTLLDQRLIAGLGNIYSAEALWRARISPLVRSDSLDAHQVAALRVAIAYVIARATGSRYTDDDTVHLDVYDKEGVPCKRCGAPIERVIQAGRSTFFCPICQLGGAVAAAKRRKKAAGASAPVSPAARRAGESTGTRSGTKKPRKKSSARRAGRAARPIISRSPRAERP